MDDSIKSATAEMAVDLALAVISSSDSPLLLLNDRLQIIAASRSFYRAYALKPATVVGHTMAELGAGEWDIPQLASLLKATASGFAEVEAFEINLQRGDRSPRRLIVNAQKLEYENEGAMRILLSVLDVTEARRSERQKNELLREKAILLHDVQNRVANSLQIIASILMQSARKVQADETRAPSEGEHPLEPIATLQQQLATSQIGEVALRSYLTTLCGGLEASMIHDRDLIVLDVDIDDSVVDADWSISIGLIVTELVINALKHGYPGQSGGKITVSFSKTGWDWTLAVADDGIGMPKAEDAKAGLGTGIIEALAGQLGAEVSVTDARPGTIVTLSHVAGEDTSETAQPDP
ncbi:histidine kinase [Bosea sp. AAP35]|uniref:sensor histidine kinase n=1 Tax=Bosea sp. AAP35 TaxID=1523417 RepID=UPI0006B9A7F0|nr:ATP-binding protein [Bosea sp. AAP35]KPF71141.1 histidine kinase [Bosea sp. AAP35]